MILHQPRQRPEAFASRRANLKYRWALPLLRIEWASEWVAYLLSNWSFLEVLEYLGSFSVLVAVIFYYRDAPDRLKQKHYQAWQVINTAQGKGGSGGRLEAMQELNADKVPLVGVDVSGAFLQGVRLPDAHMTRANLRAADLRNADLSNVDLSFADLHAVNIRAGALRNANLENTDLSDADLVGADLTGADLQGAELAGADLRNVNLAEFHWMGIQGIAKANIAGVRNAPPGFVAWARKNGASE